MQARTPLTPFEHALVDSILSEYRELPAEDELPYEFSPGFQRWAHKLIRKTHNPAWYYVNTTFKKVIIAAIIISMLAITAMAVPAIREAIIDFFLTERETSYGITFNPEEAATSPKEIEIRCTPTMIPLGFEIIDNSVNTYSLSYLWMNGDGQLIYFTQETIPENATSDNWIGIDAEGATRTSQIIGEYLVEIVWLEESYSLHWTDNAYVYSLELPNSISQEVMLEIVSSIQPIHQDTNQTGG